MMNGEFYEAWQRLGKSFRRFRDAVIDSVGLTPTEEREYIDRLHRLEDREEWLRLWGVPDLLERNMIEAVSVALLIPKEEAGKRDLFTVKPSSQLAWDHWIEIGMQEHPV